MHNILIDEEFKALIPPMSQEERTQLEANLLADGCRDPLVVWPCPTFEIRLDGGATQTLRYEEGRYQHAIDEYIGPTTAWDLDDNADDDRIDEYGDTITLDQWPHILIDGHNRYEICTRLGLPFEVVVQEFADREAVMDWMDANQLGRRNITPDQFTLLLGRRYNRAKKAQGGRSDREFGAAKVTGPNTAAKLAAEHGVSEKTVRNAGQYAEAVAVVEKAVPGFSQAIAAPRQAVIKAAAIIEKSPEKAAEILSGNKSIADVRREDWMFYGHAHADGMNVSRWMVISLPALRAAIIRKQATAIKQSNGDGTHFVAFDVRQIPDACVISSSFVVERARRAA